MNLTEIVETIQRHLDERSSIDQESFASLHANYDSETLIQNRLKELALDPQTEARILAEFFGDGPLTTALEDEAITEIVINGPFAIWCERSGRLTRHPDRFLSKTTFRNFVQRLCAETSVQTNLENPTASGKWRSYRLHICDTAISPGGIAISLRRHPDNPWTFQSLQETGWANAQDIETLRNLIVQKKNLLIIGPTGCGKTSVLNACLQSLGEAERVVIIEDSDELKPPNDASIKLLTREDPNGQLKLISQSDLVKNSLRLRPDRLVLGEIRGEEAKDLLMALSTGHNGSWGSLHAANPRQALLRLEMLIQLGAPQWSLRSVRNLIHLSLDYILVAGRNSDGRRFFNGVYRIASLEENGFVVEKVGLESMHLSFSLGNQKALSGF